MSSKIPGNNLIELLKTTNSLFTTEDLCVLWGVTNKETLNKTVYRYAKKGLLYRVRRGLYSKIPLNNLDQKELGQALLGKNSYLSTESVLAIHGVIVQSISSYTFVGETSQKIQVGSESFLSRKITPQLLLNRSGIVDNVNYSTASLERAVADMLYYSPKYYFDNDKPINWDKVKEIKSLVGY